MLCTPLTNKALRLLTREKGTEYFDYVRAIRGDPVAVKVKLAGLAHNADETRFTGSGTPRRNSLPAGVRSTPKPEGF